MQLAITVLLSIKKREILKLIFFAIEDEKIRKTWRSLIEKTLFVLKNTTSIFCSKYLLKYEFFEPDIIFKNLCNK